MNPSEEIISYSYGTARGNLGVKLFSFN